MEPENNENIQWSICCSKSSSKFIKFVMTTFFCFSIMIFSMLMISNNPEKDNSIYFSLISSILSLYIPSPTPHEDKVHQIEKPQRIEIEKEIEKV